MNRPRRMRLKKTVELEQLFKLQNEANRFLFPEIQEELWERYWKEVIYPYWRRILRKQHKIK